VNQHTQESTVDLNKILNFNRLIILLKSKPLNLVKFMVFNSQSPTPNFFSFFFIFFLVHLHLIPYSFHHYLHKEKFKYLKIKTQKFSSLNKIIFASSNNIQAKIFNTQNSIFIHGSSHYHLPLKLHLHHHPLSLNLFKIFNTQNSKPLNSSTLLI
jgi:hypothetical protein